MVTMKAWRGRGVLLLLLLLAFPSTTLAGGQAVTLQPRQVVAQYFADLSAHRYYQAYLLEAPCDRVVRVSNGPGAPVGTAAFHGRGSWNPNYARVWREVLRVVRVMSIGRFDRPLLDKGHILGFTVSGYFAFDYSAFPWANYKHKTGFHVIRIGVWQCNGQWGVDAYWLFASGGELTWS